MRSFPKFGLLKLLIPSEQTKVALSLLQTLPIEVDPYTDTQALSATLELARHQGIAAYDAAYSLPSLRLLIANRLESLLLEDLAWVFFLWEGSIWNLPYAVILL